MSLSSTEFRLDGDQAVAAVADGALLIDVRSAAGRLQNGEVKGAVIISKSDAVEILTKQIAQTTPGQKFVVFCGSIAGSEPIVRALREAGAAHAYDVEGGVSALTAAGLEAVLPPVK